MTLFPINCPYCGSYDVEWLSAQELRCLECGAIFVNPGIGREILSQGSREEGGNSESE